MPEERALIQYATPTTVEGDDDNDAHESLARTTLRFAIGAGVGEVISFFALYCASAGSVDSVIGIVAVIAGCWTGFAWLISVPLALLAWKDRAGPRRISAISLITLAAELLVAWAVIGFLILN